VIQAKNNLNRIKENVDEVRRRIRESASRVGRDPDGVRLLAATKNRDRAQVEAVVEAGVSLVGENRVQELLEKEEWLRGRAEVHFIGHLQTNKVRKVAGLVRLIHSVDSLRLAGEIDRRAGAGGFVQDVLIQVNVSGEDSKSGVSPGALPWLVSEAGAMPGLAVVGLSTIAPMDDDPERVRWVFRELRELGLRCEEDIERFTLRELSMGMTNDFEVAVEEGSTIVRIGTALFT